MTPTCTPSSSRSPACCGATPHLHTRRANYPSVTPSLHPVCTRAAQATLICMLRARALAVLPRAVVTPRFTHGANYTLFTSSLHLVGTSSTTHSLDTPCLHLIYTHSATYIPLTPRLRSQYNLHPGYTPVTPPVQPTPQLQPTRPVYTHSTTYIPVTPSSHPRYIQFAAC